MYVIKRIAGYSAGWYIAVGLINTTPDVAQAHTFEHKRDAERMCQSKYEQVVYCEPSEEITPVDTLRVE